MSSAKTDINHSEAEEEETTTVMEAFVSSGEMGGTAETERKTECRRKSHTETQGPSPKAGEWPELVFQWLIEVLCGWGKDKRGRGQCEDGGTASLRL